MLRYFSISHMIAGFVAVMVGFSTSAVLVFQAATMLGASSAQISSWLFILGISMGISCIGLSLRYKMPILTGWSTAGAALLVTCLSGVSMPEALGAFMFAAILSTLFGMSGLLEKIIDHIPRSLSAAMLAGVLLHFGMNVFIAMEHEFVLVGSMLLVYLLGKRFTPRYAIIMVLFVGISLAKIKGLFHSEDIHLNLALPLFITPVFSFSTLISVGIPLFLVTMTSQNIPGIAVLKSSGYEPPISAIISWTGIINTLFAPFGCYSLCLSAITAAICTNEEADPDPQNRYRSTVFAGLCWLSIAFFGATVVTLFAAFPKELITGIAGIALVGAIGHNLHTAMAQEKERESAMITLLVSASGISLFGIGAAFWGLVAGSLTALLCHGHHKHIKQIIKYFSPELEDERSS